MSLADSLQAGLEQFILILTILFIGLTIGRAIRKILERAFYEAKVRKIAKLNWGVFLSRMGEFLAYVVTIVIIANTLGITEIVLYILGGIILLLAVINLVLQFAFALPNLWAHIRLRKSRSITGTTFSKKGITGEIVIRRWSNLVIQTDNDTLLIPYNWIKK